MKIAIDLSSFTWTNYRSGKDPEGQEVFHEGKKFWINSAAYGYERTVDRILDVLRDFSEEGVTPIDLILVKEGLNSKGPRLAISSDYKANRGSKPDQEHKAWEQVRDSVCAVFKSVGATVVSQDYAEGDDTLAWLAKHTEEPLVIATFDNDLAVLNGVNDHNALVTVWVGGVIGVNKYGDFPHKYIGLYKALVGDSSDGIPGIRGFGPAAWNKFVNRFGIAGMDLMLDMLNKRDFDPIYEDAKVDEFVRLLYDNKDTIIRCWKLASLYPNWVNTMLNPLNWQPGMVHGEVADERLAKWAARRTLVTASNWDRFTSAALAQIKKRPWLALDIETSTPDESDDWLIAQGDPEGVDVIGSELTGMSLTFGDNMQFTVYISVDHAETQNVSKDQLRTFLEQVFALGVQPVIHNTQFEGTVLYHEFGQHWKDNGFMGMVPNWLDTKFEASYVDENDKLGLKRLSEKWLNYKQVDYKTTVTVDDVPKKMRQLTARHVFDYACDDTVTTAALHNFFKLFMQLEHTYEVYKAVEIDASYLHTMAFIKGAKVDLGKLSDLKAEDRAAYDEAEKVLNEYLISVGWAGTICPEYKDEFTPAQLKEAHLIVTGTELVTLVRTPSKIVELVENRLLKEAAISAFKGDFTAINKLVKLHFSGKPELNLGSPKQLQKLFYETLGLKPEVFNQPTPAMRAAGNLVGSPKTDNLAITYGLLNCTPEVAKVLQALRIMKMVQTRFSLFYEPLPGFVHWKTGLVHSSHNQCGTNTRRASSSKPNLQQLSKHQKVEGFTPRVRELYIPHKRGAVIVSLDFSSQELLLMAEWCKDPALVACFVGEKKIDMHSKTGVGIFCNLHSVEFSYDEFCAALANKESEHYVTVKKCRALGKSVNFGSQYRVAAKKLSTMLLVTEAEAQAMLDAKAEAFPIVEEWSQQEMEKVKATGVVHTMLGAVRHLRDAIMSSDRIESSKAPRQALSMRIQGSAAEMTKLAEGRMWKAKLLEKYDCKYFAAIHDEVVFSVMLEDLPRFIPEAHALMTANYANMQLPISSSCSVGWNFGEQEELEGDFSKENILKSLKFVEAI